ncbi:MAG TPA: cupin domain-containing protein [Acidobacteriaceae bacterium]|jgi:mannose-6-phosphate isomerase-like protein (cupin superfamily)
MITRRDLTVALVAAAFTAFGFAAADKAPVLGAAVFDWNAIPVKTTPVGSTRQFFKAPTATLEQLEVHVTTLNAGQASHPPHKHPNEELVILDQGTLDALVNGEWKRVGPGSVIFNASDQLHGVRNVGSGPATYHVINWTSTETPKQ